MDLPIVLWLNLPMIVIYDEHMIQSQSEIGEGRLVPCCKSTITIHIALPFYLSNRIATISI